MEKLIPYYNEGLPAEEMEKRDMWGNQWITEEVEGKILSAFFNYAMDKDLDKLLDVIRECFDFGDFKVREDITDFDNVTINRFIHLEGCTYNTFESLTNKKQIEICKDWKNSSIWTTVKAIVDQVAEFDE